MNEIKIEEPEINISWKCTPVPHTYYSLRKLKALQSFNKKMWKDVAYNLSEALSPTSRLSALYRSQKQIYTQDSVEKKLLANCALLRDTFSSIKRDPDNESDDLMEYIYKSTEEMLKLNSKKMDDVLKIKENKHLDDKLLNFEKDPKSIETFQDKINNLPKEWTIIQLTSDYDPSEQWEVQKNIKTNVHCFYLTVLKSQLLSPNADPITIKIVPSEIKVGEVSLFKELHDTLQANLSVIENNLRLTNNSLKKYWEKRGDCDLRLKGILRTMDINWLQGWRCMLSGDLFDEKINQIIKNKIKEAFEENKESINETIEFIIFRMAQTIHLLTTHEVLLMIWKMYSIFHQNCNFEKYSCSTCKQLKSATGFCVNCEPEKIESTDAYIKFKNMVLKLVTDFKENEQLKNIPMEKRGPIVLLVDEKLDILPWESLPSLKDQLVTRMESLHFTHALYKSLEDQFVDGYFQVKPEKGSYLLNPAGDLKKMEMRMGSFIDYWCPQWEGQRSTPPTNDNFQKYLQESDVFLYCGHNDGSQYVGGGPERLGDVKAITTLSGCGSVRLRSPGTRLLPLPVHSHYHNAKCPCVIGMLWEVTDLEVDKVTSMFLGLFLPSKASKHWGDVSKSQWGSGVIETANCDSNKYKCEPNMLKALAMARKSSFYVMIAASVVSRGLPVSIHPDYQMS